MEWRRRVTALALSVGAACTGSRSLSGTMWSVIQELSPPYSSRGSLSLLLCIVRPRVAQPLFDREGGSSDGIAALLAG